jgi:hypothetical protein
MRPVYFAASLLVAAACSDATSPAPLSSARHPAPAVTEVSITRDNETIPWVQTFANSCTGEDVQVTGELHLLLQTVTLANGEIRDTFHTNFANTTGVGLTTGTTYRATSAENAPFQGVPPGPPGGPWRSTHEGTLHLVSPGAGENLLLHFVFVVTKEPGSPPHAIVFKMDLTCTG